eukprot:1143257-Pelagomonas_calceolata.AAC.9
MVDTANMLLSSEAFYGNTIQADRRKNIWTDQIGGAPQQNPGSGWTRGGRQMSLRFPTRLQGTHAVTNG